jgi:hypothetical protein
LAVEADLDPDVLRRYLQAEIERRRAHEPEVGSDVAASETAI